MVHTEGDIRHKAAELEIDVEYHDKLVTIYHTLDFLPLDCLDLVQGYLLEHSGVVHDVVHDWRLLGVKNLSEIAWSDASSSASDTDAADAALDSDEHSDAGSSSLAGAAAEAAQQGEAPPRDAGSPSSLKQAAAATTSSQKRPSRPQRQVTDSPLNERDSKASRTKPPSDQAVPMDTEQGASQEGGMARPSQFQMTLDEAAQHLQEAGAGV
jgi:hypothetical protein